MVILKGKFITLNTYIKTGAISYQKLISTFERYIKKTRRNQEANKKEYIAKNNQLRPGINKIKSNKQEKNIKNQ